MFTPEEIEVFEKQIIHKRDYKRFLCIKLQVIDRKTQAAIAQELGFHERHVQRIQGACREEGLQACLTHYKGGNNRLLSNEEEAQVLESCEFTDTENIQQKLEAKVGKPISRQTVYNVLERQAWKLKVPRPVHPKGDEERKSLFKKST